MPVSYTKTLSKSVPPISDRKHIKKDKRTYKQVNLDIHQAFAFEHVEQHS